MHKRLVLFIAVALILCVAPAAMATHCQRCKYYWELGEWGCIQAQGTFGGWEGCVSEQGEYCQFSGNECEGHTAALAPLAAEFAVASVERLDEPAKPVAGTLVAPASVPLPATR